MSYAKAKPTYKAGDRFRAKADSSDVMPYREQEIVIVQILNPRQLMYLMAADGEHFEAHRDWLYLFWEKVEQ